MIKINIEYMAQLRLRADAPSEVITLEEGSRIADLLLAIAKKNGEALRSLILEEDGLPSNTLLCFVGDDQEFSDFVLSDGQRVTLMPPISGG
jgi:molybdopterin converting factor small subunit